MHHLPTLVVIFLAALVSFRAQAETPWPGQIAALQPADSVNPSAARIPRELDLPAVTTPDSRRSRWTGRWSGYACANKACDVKLVVHEDADGSGAAVVVAFSSLTRELVLEQTQGKLVDGELLVDLKSKPEVIRSLALRLRATGQMELLRTDLVTARGARPMGLLTKVDEFPDPITPSDISFTGTWELRVLNRDGTQGRVWDRRIRIDGNGGNIYRVNRMRENDADQACTNLDIPIEEVTVQGAYVTFMVKGSRLAGCPDTRWLIEKRGSDYGGAEQTIGGGPRLTRGVFAASKIAP